MKYLQKQFPGIIFRELHSKNSPSTGNNISTWIVNIPHVAFRRHKWYAGTEQKMHAEARQRRIDDALRIHRWPY